MGKAGDYSVALTVALSILVAGCASKPTPQPSATVQPEDRGIKIGERLSFRSKILNQDRPYWIYLPDSYQSRTSATRKYPVLYLLDGDGNFHSASGVVQFMSAGINANHQIPELIIVAIPNVARTRDLTPTHTRKDYNGKDEPNFASSGGGEKFLDFLRDELIPHIEAEYRTVPFRILVGHSFGGLLALDSLLRRPLIFQAHIAIDPSLWWDDQMLLKRAKETLQKTNDLQGPVYISMANNPPSHDFDPKTSEQAIRDFVELLRTNNSHAFRSTLEYFKSEDHGSVPLISLYHGLLFIFDEYKPAPADSEDAASISRHFAKVSQRLGFEVLPPESFVNLWGYSALSDKHAIDKAIDWFKLNVSNYPSSFNAYGSLAVAYAEKGEKELAIRNYEKVLELNPEDRHAAEQLRRLKPFSTGPADPFTNGVFRLINKQSGKALEVAGASKGDGAGIDLGRYTSGDHQQWAFTNQGGGYYHVTAAHSGKALDVSNEAIVNGGTVIQWPSHGSANQIWQVLPNGDGTYRLLNEHSRLALEVPASSKTNQINARQWEWQGRDNQKWYIFAPPRRAVPMERSTSSRDASTRND